MAMKKDLRKARIQTGKDEKVRPPHAYWMVAIVGAIFSIRIMLWLLEEARVVDRNDDAVAMLLLDALVVVTSTPAQRCSTRSHRTSTERCFWRCATPAWRSASRTKR